MKLMVLHGQLLHLENLIAEVHSPRSPYCMEHMSCKHVTGCCRSAVKYWRVDMRDHPDDGLVDDVLKV